MCVCMSVCMYAVVYPGLLRGGVYMASDSEPTKGFGDLLPINSVKGQSLCRGYGGRSPPEGEAFLSKI